MTTVAGRPAAAEWPKAGGSTSKTVTALSTGATNASKPAQQGSRKGT